LRFRRSILVDLLKHRGDMEFGARPISSSRRSGRVVIDEVKRFDRTFAWVYARPAENK
jgi:hypothetical protein